MSNMTDVIGGNNLYGGTGYSFVADRFNDSNSAIISIMAIYKYLQVFISMEILLLLLGFIYNRMQVHGQIYLILHNLLDQILLI